MFHRVLQLAPLCEAVIRCTYCFDKSYAAIKKNQDGIYARMVRKVTHANRALYVREMRRYSIKFEFDGEVGALAVDSPPGPKHLKPRATLFPLVSVEQARGICQEEFLKRYQAAASLVPDPSPRKTIVPQAVAADSSGHTTPASSPSSQGVPPNCPPWSEFHQGANGQYYAIDMERGVMWFADHLGAKVVGCSAIAGSPIQRPCAPTVSTPSSRGGRGRPSATVSQAPIDVDSDDNNNERDVFVNPNDLAQRGVALTSQHQHFVDQWVSTTLPASTVSTPPQAASVRQLFLPRQADETPPRHTAVKDAARSAPDPAQAIDAYDDFAFPIGSPGHTDMLRAKYTAPPQSMSDVSSECDSRYARQLTAYKFQDMLPVVWQVTQPSSGGQRIPWICTSEVAGPPALDVVRPHLLFGLPIKPTMKARLKATFSHLKARGQLRNMAIGTIVSTQTNRIPKAPYVNVTNDRFIADQPLKYNTVGPDSWFNPITDDTCQAFNAVDIQRLNYYATQLYRVVNFAATLGDAENLSRSNQLDTRKKEGRLNTVLRGREECFNDLNCLATELLQMTTLMMRDVILGNAKREFTPEELLRYRYARMWRSEFVIPPKVLGAKEPERTTTLPPIGINLRTYSVSSEDNVDGVPGDGKVDDSAELDDQELDSDPIMGDFVAGQQPPSGDDVVVLSSDPNVAPRVLSAEEAAKQRDQQAGSGDTPMPSPGQEAAADAMDAE